MSQLYRGVFQTRAAAEPMIQEALYRIYSVQTLYHSNQFSSCPVNRQKKNNALINYWKFSPGENGKHWKEFYSEGIISIDWEGTENLNSYTTEDQMARIIKLQRFPTDHALLVPIPSAEADNVRRLTNLVVTECFRQGKQFA